MMDQNKLSAIKEYLKAEGKVLPQYVEKDYNHWNSRIYMAKVLNDIGSAQDAYCLLRGVYEDNTFNFDKELHGDYEEYIIQKVKFFELLAKLSLEVTREPAQSIPYLDEALIMLDEVESVYPYINPKDIDVLKKTYLKMLA